MPVTNPAEDIPEHLVSALERHECRDDGAFGTGAMYGALTYCAALAVFTFFPALWLNWKLQGSWKLLIQPAVVVAIPVHVLARLREIGPLANRMIALEVMMVLLGVLTLPFLAWATLRGPKVYTRLTEALTRCRELNLDHHELKEGASQKK